MTTYRSGQPVRLTINRAQRAAEVVCDMPETGEAVEPIHLDGDAVAARHTGARR